jgi:hypothetical protein
MCRGEVGGQSYSKELQAAMSTEEAVHWIKSKRVAHGRYAKSEKSLQGVVH